MLVELDKREERYLKQLEFASGHLLMFTSRDRLKNSEDPLALEVKRINSEITKFIRFYKSHREKVRVYPTTKPEDGGES